MPVVRKVETARIRFARPALVAGLGAVAIAVALGPAEAGTKPKLGKRGKLDCKNAQLPPVSKRDFKCIDEGFRLFTEETFEGNGRTCGTCHIPEENYNIFPDTIKKLSPAERRLVFARNVPGLENETLVRKFALFNIAGGPHSDATDIQAFRSPEAQEHPHEFPIFRSTMTVQALGATTFVGAGGFDGTPLFPAVCSEGLMVDENGAPVPVVDEDGNQVVAGPGGGVPLNVSVRSQLPQLGWAGDGSPGTPKGRPGDMELVWSGVNSPGVPTGRADEGDLLECREHHGNEDVNADGSIRAFANGAIAQHNPATLQRIAKTTACPDLTVDEPDAYCDEPYDFRFASNAELDAIALFQRWLGRRFLNEDERARMDVPNTGSASAENGEFDITLLNFTDSRVAKGRTHYANGAEFANPKADQAPDFGAGCNACHRNAGARGVPFGGGNTNFATGVELASSGEFDDAGNDIRGPDELRIGEIAFGTIGVNLPHDEGAFTVPGPRPRSNRGEDAFNVQSLIEAPQKKAFFHNHRVVGDLEDSIRLFYGAEDFTTRGGGFTSLAGLEFGDPEDDPDDADIPQYFPKGDGIEHIGAFLRALSAYYRLRDCERMIDEAIARIRAYVSPDLAVKHCAFNLQDVRKALRGAHLRPKPHRGVIWKSRLIEYRLKKAARRRGVKRLRRLKAQVTALRERIATLPEPAPASAGGE